MEQPQYNMLHRQKVEEDYKRIYETYGLGTTIWSPLMSGILTGKYNDGMPENTRISLEGYEWLKDVTLVEQNLEKVRKLTVFAKELGVSMPLMALAWCLKNSNVSTVILGASKVSQLEENLKAPEVVSLLTDEVMERIEGILENKPRTSMF